MMKKGSLNLSIEAIVIVVIAFVVLGLGLGFVRGQFKSITETTTSIQDQIRQQITEDLRTGDKKLSFPTNEFTINKKESTVTAIGIKNTQQGTLKYKIDVQRTEGGNLIFGEDVSDNFLYEKVCKRCNLLRGWLYRSRCMRLGISFLRPCFFDSRYSN